MSTQQVLVLAIIIVFVIAFVVTLIVLSANTQKVIDANEALVEKHNALLERNLLQEGELEEQKLALEEQRGLIDGLRRQQEVLAAQIRNDAVDELTRLQQLTRGHREHIELTADMTDEQLMEYVDVQMEATRMYTNPSLSLKEAATALGLTQKRIGQLFKHHAKYANLNDYLSEKRFLLACRLIREHPQWKIEAVALAAGFQTRRTFQDVVKSRLGLTPSQLRQSLCNQDLA